MQFVVPIGSGFKGTLCAHIGDVFVLLLKLHQQLIERQQHFLYDRCSQVEILPSPEIQGRLEPRAVIANALACRLRRTPSADQFWLPRTTIWESTIMPLLWTFA